jgi:ferredoxin
VRLDGAMAFTTAAVAARVAPSRAGPENPRPTGGARLPMQVRIRHGVCRGHAECVEIAPAVFALDSRHKAIVFDPEAGSLEVLLDAADSCPCGAIVVEDDDGNILAG